MTGVTRRGGPNGRPTARALGPVGVICHQFGPTVAQCADFVRTAERAGADWCMLPDALGWRDLWMTLTAAATATERISIGPGVTNPYTRHPFVTLSALATLDEISGGRAFLGVAAGGSELPVLAGFDRRDAPERVRDLVDAVRRAAAGDPPIPLLPPIGSVPIVGGARGRRMLEAVGDVCDLALLWDQTFGELSRAAAVVRERRAAIAWSPLRAVDGDGVRAAVVYGVLNSRAPVRRDLGVDPSREASIREVLEARGMEAAAALIPDAVMESFLAPEDPSAAAAAGRELGASVIAVQGFDLDSLPDRVAWAHEVGKRLADRAAEEL